MTSFHRILRNGGVGERPGPPTGAWLQAAGGPVHRRDQHPPGERREETRGQPPASEEEDEDGD